MTTENIGLFQAMNAKMNYLAERQKVISQNVANADTPGYVSQDLNKVDFGRMVERVTSDKTKQTVRLETSNAGHLLPVNEAATPKEGKNKSPYEVNPDGNAVVIEEQMVRASQNQLDYGLMLNIYRNNMDMIRTSLGKRQ